MLIGFHHYHKGIDVLYKQAPGNRRDYAPFLELADSANRSFYRRSDNIRYILSGKPDIYKNTVVCLSAVVFAKTDYNRRDPAFHL